MVHLLLAPPRHAALGLTPQTPNLMLIRAEPLAHMPPWCPLLAAAAGTDSCARLAGAQQRARFAPATLVRRLRLLLRPQGRRGYRRPGTRRWG